MRFFGICENLVGMLKMNLRVVSGGFFMWLYLKNCVRYAGRGKVEVEAYTRICKEGPGRVAE